MARRDKDIEAHHRLVESERERLGYYGQNPSAPRYSICVPNYNMSDTLERALGSVAEQLDRNLYEIIVIDDGSNDDSLQVLDKLSQKYPNLRYISLPRDLSRKLGETRNISIRAARGEYVLIHIDADDVWEPYIQDFVTLFHKVEQAVGKDQLLVGQQIGMAKRDFLLQFGPYENIYRCEDRNMMMKLAKRDLLMFMDYRVYRTRLSRPQKKKFFKGMRDSFSHMSYEMRQNEPKAHLIIHALTAPFKSGGNLSFPRRLILAVFILPIYLISRFQPPIINQITREQLHQYHEAHRGTYAELMTQLGANPDLSFLSSKAQEIFSHNVKLPGFKSAA